MYPPTEVLREDGTVFPFSNVAVSMLDRSREAPPAAPAPPPRPVAIRGLGPYRIKVGDSQVLTFVFRNTHDKPLASVRLVIAIDSLGMLATHASTGHQAEDGEFSWKFANLQPGEEKSLQVTVVAQGDSCTRQVRVSMHSETEASSKRSCRVEIDNDEADLLEAAKSTALFNLNTLRAQIELYKAQHGGRLPNASLSDLTNKTTYRGKSYGPYMVAIPDNPFSGSHAVKNSARATITASDVTAKDRGGWIYGAATGDVRIDHADLWEK